MLSDAQRNIFEASAGFAMSDLAFLVSVILVALYAMLVLVLSSGLLKGFSRGTVDGFELFTRSVRMILIFNILLYLVTV